MPNWWRAAASSVKRFLSTPNNRHYHTIQAVPREISGHRVSIRDRAQGRIPAVVFSQTYTQTKPDDPTSISASTSVARKRLVTTERKQIKAILDSVELPFLCSTTFPIQIRAGSGSSTLIESGKVLPVKIHRDEKTGNILNLVFVWAEDGTSLKVDVPIVFKGEDICPGLNKGGFLRKIRPCLKFLCPVESIPPKIEVDVSKLDIGDKVYMHDIAVDPALKLLSKDDSIPICKIGSTEMDTHEVAK